MTAQAVAQATAPALLELSKSEKIQSALASSITESSKRPGEVAAAVGKTAKEAAETAFAHRGELASQASTAASALQKGILDLPSHVIESAQSTVHAATGLVGETGKLAKATRYAVSDAVSGSCGCGSGGALDSPYQGAADLDSYIVGEGMQWKKMYEYGMMILTVIFLIALVSRMVMGFSCTLNNMLYGSGALIVLGAIYKFIM